MVTNAINIASELVVNETIRLVVTGGVARPQSYELIGPLADRTLEDLSVDVVFLGVDGVNAGGATTHDEIEAQTDRKLVERAARVIVVARLVEDRPLGPVTNLHPGRDRRADHRRRRAGGRAAAAARRRRGGGAGLMATASPSFLAVATNPAIDRVARLAGRPSGIVRASEMLETPGGKAIHTACVAAELGARSAVITTAGGHSGELLLALLGAEPLDGPRRAGVRRDPRHLHAWSAPRAATWSRSTSPAAP